MTESVFIKNNKNLNNFSKSIPKLLPDLDEISTPSSTKVTSLTITSSTNLNSSSANLINTLYRDPNNYSMHVAGRLGEPNKKSKKIIIKGRRKINT